MTLYGGNRSRDLRSSRDLPSLFIVYVRLFFLFKTKQKKKPLRRVHSAENRDHGRVGHPRDGGQRGELEVRDPAERPGPGLHILVPEQPQGAGLRDWGQGDLQ